MWTHWFLSQSLVWRPWKVKHPALCMWTEHLLFLTLSYSFYANTVSSQQSGSPEGPLLSAKFSVGSVMRDLLVEKPMGRVDLFVLSFRRSDTCPLPRPMKRGQGFPWPNLTSNLRRSSSDSKEQEERKGTPTYPNKAKPTNKPTNKPTTQSKAKQTNKQTQGRNKQCRGTFRKQDYCL